MDCLGTDHLILIDGSWSGDKTFSGEDLFFRDLRQSFYLHLYKVCNNINPGSGYFIWKKRLLDFFFQIPFQPRPFHSKSNGCCLTYDKCFVRHIIFVTFRCIETHRFLLWFTVSVIVCLCMYVLEKFLFSTAVWPFFFFLLFFFFLKETVSLAFCL